MKEKLPHKKISIIKITLYLFFPVFCISLFLGATYLRYEQKKTQTEFTKEIERLRKIQMETPYVSPPYVEDTNTTTVDAKLEKQVVETQGEEFTLPNGNKISFKIQGAHQKSVELEVAVLKHIS